MRTATSWAGPWARPVPAPSCTRTPAAWSLCPACRTEPRTVARDINDAGVIVGTANAGGTDLGHAVVWSGGSVQDLGTLGTGYYSEAWGINNAGQVVGWSYTNGGNGLTGVHGFLYTAGGRAWSTSRRTATPATAAGHQRRGPGDGLQDRVRRLSRLPLAGRSLSWTWACFPGSRTALAGPSTRPATWPATRPPRRATASSCSATPTQVVSRTWAARASTTSLSGINASGTVVGTRGNSAEACRPVHRRGRAAGPEHADRSVAGLGPPGRQRHQRCRTDRRVCLQQLHRAVARREAAARGRAASATPTPLHLRTA